MVPEQPMLLSAGAFPVFPPLSSLLLFCCVFSLMHSQGTESTWKARSLCLIHCVPSLGAGHTVGAQ